MRCRACDVTLSDFEATRKSRKTGEYIDLCDTCFTFVKDAMEVDEREDLRDTDDIITDHEDLTDD